MSRKPSGLALLLNYDSDTSEEDLDYTSDDGRKRKPKVSQVNSNKRRCTDPDISVPVIEKLKNNDDIPMDFEKLESSILNRPNDFQKEDGERNIPIPMEFLNSFGEFGNDPSKHQGRVRSFSHEKGNWASIVYIPLLLGTHSPYFTSLVSALCRTCREQGIELLPSEDFHISLSKTLNLIIHWIPPITQELKKNLSCISVFSAWLHGLEVYTNEEKTRTFLGLKVVQGRNEMVELVEEVNSVIKEYRQPMFYKDCSFHVTLGWIVGDFTNKLRSTLPLLENLCDHYFSLESDTRTFEVNEIHFKTGNKICNISLMEN